MGSRSAARAAKAAHDAKLEADKVCDAAPENDATPEMDTQDDPSELVRGIQMMLNRAGLSSSLATPELLRENVLLRKAEHDALEKNTHLIERIKALESERDELKKRDCCAICMDRPKERVLVPCGHTICSICAEQQEVRVRCPFCKTDVSRFCALYLDV